MSNLTQLSTFNCSTEVTYGLGAVCKLSDIIQANHFRHVLIVCDQGVKQAGLLDVVMQEMEKTKSDYTIFSDVEPNPSSATVAKGHALFAESRADFIVAIGGGSPLDTAKGISILATNGGNIVDYEGVNKMEHPGAPLCAIPTTAGTASEVTIFTVITDLERQYKLTIGGRNLAARWAIVDPELTLTLPPHLTASTGLDALVHAIESYTSTMAYPLSEALALEAIRLISANLRQAVYNGQNITARSEMLLGSLVAGLAFNNTRLGNVHAMSHPLSARFQVPHGVANSVLLLHVMEFNRLAVPDKFARIAVAMGEVEEFSTSVLRASESAVRAVQRLSQDIGIPDNFRDYHVSSEAIPDMVQDAIKSGNIAVNPRKTSIQDLQNLYEKTI